MLDVLHINKKIGKKEILKDVTFNIEVGKVFSIVGYNGAGKSTLLLILAGILKEDMGCYLLNNNTVFESKKIKKSILYIPDDLEFSYTYTLKNIIDFYKVFYNVDLDYLQYLTDLFELDLLAYYRNLSKGQKKRFLIVLSLSILPKLLLLDETFDGLDPKAKSLFKHELKKLKQKTKITIILSSHSVKDIVEISDEIGYLKDGKMITYNSFLTSDYNAYRVICKSDFKLDNINSKIQIYKRSIVNNTCIIDMYSDKNDIYNNFKDNIIDIGKLPFSDWVMYEMEEIL